MLPARVVVDIDNNIIVIQIKLINFDKTSTELLDECRKRGGVSLNSAILIPIITFNAGKSIGKVTSDKITEYKTITRTIDLNSGKIIGDSYEIYDYCFAECEYLTSECSLFL